ncbi:MAG: TetR/AcrR family transcriptional regulator [Pseudomonadota bacterium]
MTQLSGNTKVTRADWLHAARDILITRGVGEVKILTLSETLSVSRSSFYWYFKDRTALLNALLDDWEATNIKTIVDHCDLPANGIDQAACNFFRCFVDPTLFDQRLDFAIREWARRDPAVRNRIDAADDARLAAVIAMFVRHGYAAEEAGWRARIIYFMQLGYHALEITESMDTRMARLPGYIMGFTGRPADPEVVAGFKDFFTHRVTH